MSASLDDTLLWLCAVPSPIGEERALCDAVQARLGERGLTARRYGDSIVVPVTRWRGGQGAGEPRRPHVALGRWTDASRARRS